MEKLSPRRGRPPKSPHEAMVLVTLPRKTIKKIDSTVDDEFTNRVGAIVLLIDAGFRALRKESRR